MGDGREVKGGGGGVTHNGLTLHISLVHNLPEFNYVCLVLKENREKNPFADPGSLAPALPPFKLDFGCHDL